MPDCIAIAVALLKDGFAVRLRAEGRSMRPTILDGDLLTLLPVPPSGPRIGDIVLFHRPHGRPAIHRVVGMETVSGLRRFQIRGDAQAERCDWVRPDCMAGRVVALRRNGRTLRLSSPLSRAAQLAGARLRQWAVRLVTAKPRRPARHRGHAN